MVLLALPSNLSEIYDNIMTPPNNNTSNELLKGSIFFSHSPTNHRETIQKLASQLKAEKTQQLSAIVDFKVSVEKVIDQADLVVICLTQNYFQERIKEIDYADRSNKPMFILRFDKASSDLPVSGRFGAILSNAQDTFNLSEFADFEEGAREFVKRVIRTLQATRFLVLNAPEAPPWFKPRSKYQEEALARQLKQISPQSPGVLLITGPAGVGKTTFLSALLREPGFQHHLAHNCQLKSAIWVSCYKWKHERAFLTNDSTAISRILKNELTNVLRRNGRRSMPDLFVFDDVGHAVLIDILHNYFYSKKIALCLIITEQLYEAMKENNTWHLLLIRTENHQLDVPLLNELEITAFVKSSLLTGKENLTHAHIRDLVLHCRGLPRNAVQMADLIRSIDPRLSKCEFERNFNWIVQRHASDFKPEYFRAKTKVSTLPEISTEQNETYCSILICEDVPKFELYFRRRDEEQEILEGIRRLSIEPSSKGCFLMGGSPGIGKTTLVSSVLHNSEYNRHFVRTCDLQVVLWLNCSKLKTAEAVGSAFIEIGYRHVIRSDVVKWKFIADMVDYFHRKQVQRILFILDDVTFPSLLPDLRKNCENCLILAIFRDSSLLNQSSVTKNKFELGPMAEEQVVEMFETTYDLKDKLTQKQLQQLATRFCNGSPIAASQVAAQFHRCRKYLQRFSDLMDERLFNEQEPNFLFNNTFDMVQGPSRDCFLSLLLFDSHKPISILDLMILWARSVEETADVIAVLEELFLIQHSGIGSETRFYLHRTFYEAAFQRAFQLYQVNNVATLRRKIASSVSPGGDLVELLRKLIEKDRFDLLCFLVAKFVKSEHISKTAYERAATVLTSLSTEAQSEFQSFQDGQGRTALMGVAKCGHLQILSALLQKYPTTISLRDDNGWSAFTWAIYHRHLDTARLLHEAWPDAINIADSSGKNCALFAIQSIRDEKIVDFLLGEQPDYVRERYELKRTTLMVAAKYGNYPAVQVLCRRWPDGIRTVDEDGRSALSFAAENGNLDVVRFLNETWSDGIAVSDFQNHLPLVWACRSGKIECVRYLFEAWPAGFPLLSKGCKSIVKEALHLNDDDDVPLASLTQSELIKTANRDL